MYYHICIFTICIFFIESVKKEECIGISDNESDNESECVLSTQQRKKFYSHYNDEDLFIFIKRYMLLLESAILRKKNILLSVLPLFIIHIISQYASLILNPLFVMPSLSFRRNINNLSTQKRQFRLNNYVYKFEFVVFSSTNLHIKHKLSYYPNRGLFYYCNFENGTVTKFDKYQVENYPICGDLYVSIQIEYHTVIFTIKICVWNNNFGVINNKHFWRYSLDNTILSDCCCGALLNSTRMCKF